MENPLKNYPRAYFVGKCLLDKLLGVPVERHDILIEGDLSEDLPWILGSKVKVHNWNLRDFVGSADFTCNLLAQHVHTGTYIDVLGSVGDIKQRVLRTRRENIILNPALLLEGAALASEIGFEVNVDTWLSFLELGYVVKLLDPETKRDYLNRILMSPKPSKAFQLLLDTKILTYFLPDFEKASQVVQSRRSGLSNVFQHTLLALDKSEPSLLIRLAVLFHDFGKYSTMTVDDAGHLHFFRHENVSEDLTRAIMAQFEYPPALIDDVALLVRHHMFDADPKLTRKGVRNLIKRVGEKHIYNLLLVRMADRAGVPETVSMDKIDLLKKKVDKELSK